MDLSLQSHAQKVDILLTTNRFTFKSKLKTIELATKVSKICDKKNTERIVFGDVNEPHTTIFTEELFVDDIDTAHDLMHLLEAFISDGVKSVISKHSILRPVITFHNIEVFNPLFRGYERGIFRNAAAVTGMLVEFRESSNKSL